MHFTVFYAWQSDRPDSTNRRFIEKALADAIGEIQADATLGVSLTIDSDTKNVPGTADIANTILAKIDTCGVFLADVTLTGKTDRRRGREQKLAPNANVLLELGYPRIILGVAHPPLDENNCPELAFICGRAKTLRDAITHPAPTKLSLSLGVDKQQEVFMIDPTEAEHIVDSAVHLVRRIETALHGDDERLFWLRDRVQDGRFPPETFE